jgi:hypothetical protein
MSGPQFQGFAHPSRSRFCQEKIVRLKRPVENGQAELPRSVFHSNTTPLSYGSRLATMVYGLLLVIESWQLHVSSVTQVLIVLSVATLDSMHVLPIPAEA